MKQKRLLRREIQMRKKIKSVLFVLMTAATCTLMAGCASEKTPYEINNSENYNVSVKFDANGGTFTTNTSIIVDSFNIDDMNKNSSGKAEIALISPDNEVRGNDAFTATKNGYFLAGWYASRTEIGVDEKGNPTYSYGDKWDFDKDLLEVDASKHYSAEEPVMTLYAAWVPMFEIQFYDLTTKEYMSSYTFDPTLDEEISIPYWNQETGAVEMFDFPEKDGYTLEGVYAQVDGANLVGTQTLEFTGSVDYETGTAKDNVMKLYIDYIEGEWYHIYTAEQFIENASVNGCYEIHADLDFAGKNWPTSLMHGNFNGIINGNGYSFKNIELSQTNNSKVNSGLFGNLTDKAKIADLTFDSVNFTIKSGTRMTGACFGLLAGTLSSEASLTNVNITNSKLLIDSGCYFGVEDYSIGLLCGMGDASVISNANITCEATGKNPEKVNITVEGNVVTVEIITE